MPKMKYVGLKIDGERAFSEKTDIVWMPGDEHNVSEEHAALMAPHGDVWKRVKPGPSLADVASAAAAQEAAEKAAAAAKAAQEAEAKAADDKAKAEAKSLADEAAADARAAKIAETLPLLDAMADDEVREFAKSIGVTLAPNMKSENLRPKLREVVAA